MKTANKKVKMKNCNIKPEYETYDATIQAKK